MVLHHPPAEYLIDYAAGSASEAISVLIATHMALCPQCRASVANLEALGGQMFEAESAEVAPLPMPPVLDAPLSADPYSVGPSQEPAPNRSAPIRPWAIDPTIPEPLRRYLAKSPRAPRWHWRLPGVMAMPIHTFEGDSGPLPHLLRIPAGKAMPRHSHEGTELTLVLAGGFEDETGHYARGDIGFGDGSLDHRPVADKDCACVCLVVMDAPLRLTGRFGSIVNSLLRFAS
jgi:putative transcriptional regulator